MFVVVESLRGLARLLPSHVDDHSILVRLVRQQCLVGSASEGVMYQLLLRTYVSKLAVYQTFPQ